MISIYFATIIYRFFPLSYFENLMPYFEQIRKNLDSQDLIDIYNQFATNQDTSQIVTDHSYALSDDTYRKSIKCDLIERCLIRFDKPESHPAIAKLQNQIKELKAAHEITNKCYEAQKSMISVQIEQIQELQRSINHKIATINDLEEHCNNLSQECGYLARSRSTNILQGAEEMLNPGTRWLAKFFLSQEITKRVADKFRS